MKYISISKTTIEVSRHESRVLQTMLNDPTGLESVVEDRKEHSLVFCPVPPTHHYRPEKPPCSATMLITKKEQSAFEYTYAVNMNWTNPALHNRQWYRIKGLLQSIDNVCGSIWPKTITFIILQTLLHSYTVLIRRKRQIHTFKSGLTATLFTSWICFYQFRPDISRGWPDDHWPYWQKWSKPFLKVKWNDLLRFGRLFLTSIGPPFSEAWVEVCDSSEDKKDATYEIIYFTRVCNGYSFTIHPVYH